MPLIKPDWDIFKAKFSDDPNGAFEWLCYLLICKEFNLPNGIFRYLNQSGMETNPITHNKEIYAWEAKFYSGKLSENTDEFKEKIKIIKEKNPEVRNMIFFTHLEWGESPKKNERDSKPKDDIEKKAKESQIKIEWRCKSYFEPLCLKDNLSVILNHFFVRDTSLFDKFKKINKDNEDYLKLIKSEIKYKDQKITLDQSENFSKLISAINNSQWVIVTGESGVGKSSLLKEFYNKNPKKFPIFISQGSDFVRNITNDLLLNQLSLGDLNSIVADVTKKFFVIDSAEALLECRDFKKIKMIFNQLAESGWTIYLNIKESSFNQFSKKFEFPGEIIKINKLPDTALNDLSKKHQIALPEDHRLYQLLKTPFYLELFLSIEIDKNAQIKEFKELLWQKQILNSEKGLNINSKEQIFFKLIKQKQQENSFYFSDTSDSTILQELQTQGILSYKQGLGYWIVHDIYEDLASEKIIHAEFLRRSSDNGFLNTIKQYSAKYKMILSNWLVESINDNSPPVITFIESNIEISTILDEEKILLLPILQTDYSKDFFHKFKEQILKNDSKLLPEIIKTLKTQCIEIDDTFLKSFGINYPLNPLGMRILDTRPKGSGWKHFIDFLYSNWASFKTEDFSLFLDLFYDWSLKNTSSKEAGYISILAIQYLQFLEQNRDKYFIDIDEEKLFLVIIFGANHALNELKEVLLSIDNRKTGIIYRFGEFIIKDLRAFSLANSFPDEIISICQQYWLQKESSRINQYQSQDIDDSFGIRRLRNYYPSSAHQTPIFTLLNSHYSKAVDFILNFTDRAALKYMDSSLDDDPKTIKVNLNRDENKSSEQIFSHRLWQVHRGNHANSDILESIHMALEKYLLAQAEILDREALENILFYLLENTKSCSITAVVTSIVLAYPHKTFRIALKLLAIKEIMRFDFLRQVCERNVPCPMGIGALGLIHQNERLAARKMPWRRNNLEYIIFHYQINAYSESPDNFALRRNLIGSCLDKHYSKLPVQITQGIMNWRMSLAKMDIRKMEIRENKLETGEINYPFNPILEDDLKAYIQKNQKEQEPLKFKIFLENRLSNSSPLEFNYDSETIMNYIKTIQKNIKDYDEHEQLIPNKAAIVLLREHFQELNKEDQNLCKNLIFQLAEKAFLKSYSYDHNAIDESLKSLPRLLDYFPDELINILEVFIRVFLFSTHSIPDESFKLLYDKAEESYESLIAGLIILKTNYQEEKIFWNTNMSSDEWRQLEEFDKSFKETHFTIFERTKNSEVSISEANDFIQKLDPSNLVLVFEALPNSQLSQNLQRLIYLLVERYLSFEKEAENERTCLSFKQSFCDKLAELVFNNTEDGLDSSLNLLINNFQNLNHDFLETLFQSLIHANDQKQQFSIFWNIWNKFKPCLIKYVQAKLSFYYDDELIRSFLFSSQWIILDIHDGNWQSFRGDEDFNFFDDVINQIGDDPSVLISVLIVLDQYASRYWIEKPDKVISWVETMSQSEKIQKISSGNRIELIERLETFIQHFIKRHLTRIKQEPSLKNKVLNIVNYLESNGSQKAVLLREFVI
jgi:hypothetical protein